MLRIITRGCGKLRKVESMYSVLQAAKSCLSGECGHKMPTPAVGKKLASNS